MFHLLNFRFALNFWWWNLSMIIGTLSFTLLKTFIVCLILGIVDLNKNFLKPKMLPIYGRNHFNNGRKQCINSESYQTQPSSHLTSHQWTSSLRWKKRRSLTSKRISTKTASCLKTLHAHTHTHKHTHIPVHISKIRADRETDTPINRHSTNTTNGYTLTVCFFLITNDRDTRCIVRVLNVANYSTGQEEMASVNYM